jgi:hypothetical protein
VNYLLGNWKAALALVLALGCGKTDRFEGGGESETHWLALCKSDADCAPAAMCLCGVCSKPCSSDRDCDGVAPRTTCATAEMIAACGATPPVAELCLSSCNVSNDCRDGFDCQDSSCTPREDIDRGTGGIGGGPGTAGGPAAQGGAAGDPSGQGGNGDTTCIPDPMPGGGANSIYSTAPDSVPCPPEHEGFELCTDTRQGVPNVLSRCSSGNWEVVANPSACTTSWQECNVPGAGENICCDVPRYCANSGGFCDGERWWMSD